MANVLYPKGKEAFLSGAIAMATDTIKVQAIDLADYTYSAAHDFLDDVAAISRVGSPVTMTSKTLTNGVFDAADTTIASVTGDQFEALLIYKDTGVEATSALIALLDTATGLPITPSGGNVLITWDNGANKIFAL